MRHLLSSVRMSISLVIVIGLCGATNGQTTSPKELPTTNPTAQAPSGIWIAGDLHFHSKYSDGDRWPTDQVQTLRNRGLEYAFLTDHTCLLPQDGRQPQIYAFNGWDECLGVNVPGEFLYAQGAEYTNAHTYRHANVLPIYPPTFHHEQAGFTDFGNEGMMYREMHGLGGLVLINHPQPDVPVWTSYNFDAVTIDGTDAFFKTLGTHARGMDTMFVGMTDAHSITALAAGPTTSIFVPSLTWENIRDAFLARHSYINWTSNSDTVISLKAYRGSDYLGMQGDSVIANANETLTFQMEGYYAGGGAQLRLFYTLPENPTNMVNLSAISIGNGAFSRSVNVPITRDAIFYAGIDYQQACSNHLRVKIDGKPDWHSLCGSWKWQNDRYEQLDSSSTYNAKLMKAVTQQRVIPFNDEPHQVMTKMTLIDLTGSTDERIGLIGHRSFFPDSEGDRVLVLSDQSLWLYEEQRDEGIKMPFAYAEGDVIWLKMRFDGDWVQGKAWHDDQLEPINWMLSRCLSDHEFQSGGPSGKAGFYAARAKAAFDEFTVLDDATQAIIAKETFDVGATPIVAPAPDRTETRPVMDFQHFEGSSVNLLPNDGAETGDLSGWTVTGNCAAVTTEPVNWGPAMQPYFGSYFFRLGPDDAPSMKFTVDLSPHSARRDAGTLRYLTWMASSSHTDSDDDPSRLTVNQYDSDGTLIDSRTTGWLHDWFQGRWNDYIMPGLVMPQAATLDLVISASPRTDGQARAYVDGLRLSLGIGEPKQPTVAGESAIAVSTQTIQRTTTQTDPLPTDTFTVHNSGAGTLNYTVQSDQPWLSATPASGDSTSASDVDTITLSYDPSTVAVGLNVATIQVTDATAPGTPTIIQVELTVLAAVPGDFDGDDDVDQEDFGRFQACLTGEGSPDNDPICTLASLDGDPNVDETDLLLFQGCMSGANVPANANCANP